MDIETLKIMSDLELIMLQAELRKHPEDKNDLQEVLIELKERKERSENPK
jgi:hypothetical protein